jgi:hypothetical protein
MAYQCREASGNRRLHQGGNQMRTTGAIITALILAVSAQAAVITFTGIVDQVQLGSQFKVGDTLKASFVFNGDTGAVRRYTIVFGQGSDLHTIAATTKEGRVTYDSDPAHGSVFWQVTEMSFIEFTLQAATPDGVIPPIEEFNLNDFIIFGAFGHMTELPLIQ